MQFSPQRFVESQAFQRFITGMILLNALVLGLATSKELMASCGVWIAWTDRLIVAVFTVEILLRLYVYKTDFFKDPWSLFDFFVVAISLVPATGELSVLRSLRVIRLFRLLTVVPQMRLIIAALLKVIPGIGSIAMILMLFFYVFSIMATGLFGEAFPQWFGTLGDSLYTLFQIMTLESWSMGIARPVMEVYPLSWIFFIVFILVVTFIMVNLFIGIIVDAIFSIKEESRPEEPVSAVTLETLSREIAELKALLQQAGRRG